MTALGRPPARSSLRQRPKRWTGSTAEVATGWYVGLRLVLPVAAIEDVEMDRSDSAVPAAAAAG